jgi:t-SNARE complex subunit (syntaxin)
MSAIRADVCDNSRSDVMRAIRISWRIVMVVVVVVVVVVVNDVAQGKGSRSSKTTKSETL